MALPPVLGSVMAPTGGRSRVWRDPAPRGTYTADCQDFT
jgi:hypothetical protein